ncbi:MAG: Type 1 glutamine amidotransferase-like domain-containing protein [bacterium]
MIKPKKIVAIGGGEIGRAGYSVETFEIDQEIIRLTGKKHPMLLFLPTASGDSEGYVQDISRHFGEELGCKVETLYLIKEKPSLDVIRNKILGADIIYVGGGNTLRMMKLWRKIGVDKLLLEAYDKGVLMSGVSAGAICWFRFGNSDSRRTKNPAAPLIKVRGLDIFSFLYCPHYNKETDRRAELKKMMQKTSGVAIAVDNCCALEIIDDQYRIVASRDEANAYQVYWSRGKFIEQKIPKSQNFKSLNNLWKK